MYCLVTIPAVGSVMMPHLIRVALQTQAAVCDFQQTLVRRTVWTMAIQTGIGEMPGDSPVFETERSTLRGMAGHAHFALHLLALRSMRVVAIRAAHPAFFHRVMRRQ